MHVCPVCVTTSANVLVLLWSWGVHFIAYFVHLFARGNH